MAGPSNFTEYDLFKNALGNKVMNLNSDTFKIALFTSTSNAGTTSLSHTGGAPPLYSDLTNEVSNANGYTTGGVTVTPTWSNSSGTQTFTVTPATWTASGAGITAYYAVVYDFTSGNIIAWCYLDSTPQNVTVSSGLQLTVSMTASGVFQMA